MVAGWIAQKRRYRQYKTRAAQLPGSYLKAIEALERYMLFFGPGTGGGVVTMLEDLADLFEQSAANETPLHAVVGEDPVAFAEAFLQNYPEGQWMGGERERLTRAFYPVAIEEPWRDGPSGVGRP